MAVRSRNDLSDLLALHGVLTLDWIDSRALAGNAFGDPARRLLGVYTPPGYDPEGSKRYPVLYVLHGYTGDLAASVASRPWEPNVVQRADRLMQGATMLPALVVIVDGNTRLGGSQYVDSIHNGAYATYVVRDVIDYVDRSYRTIAHAGGRGVLGKSSGGFGSLHLTMNYPGMFAAFASHSGDSYFRLTQVRSFVHAQRALDGHVDLAAFVAEFEGKAKRGGDAFAAMEIMGYSAAYSPTGAQPFAFDLPFDRRTGEIREDVFGRWLAFDPAEQIAHKAKELAALRLRYLDCGRRDEYALDLGARIMAQRMRDHGLEVRHEEFDDDHGRIGYRYDVSLPALAAVLERA